jgi:hypothetical protein
MCCALAMVDNHQVLMKMVITAAAPTVVVATDVQVQHLM